MHTTFWQRLERAHLTLHKYMVRSQDQTRLLKQRDVEMRELQAQVDILRGERNSLEEVKQTLTADLEAERPFRVEATTLRERTALLEGKTQRLTAELEAERTFRAEVAKLTEEKAVLAEEKQKISSDLDVSQKLCEERRLEALTSGGRGVNLGKALCLKGVKAIFPDLDLSSLEPPPDPDDEPEAEDEDDGADEPEEGEVAPENAP